MVKSFRQLQPFQALDINTMSIPNYTLLSKLKIENYKKFTDSSVDSVKTRREKILAYKNTGCFLLQPALVLRNSDSVRRCDGIFNRRVQKQAQK